MLWMYIWLASASPPHPQLTSPSVAQREAAAQELRGKRLPKRANKWRRVVEKLRAPMSRAQLVSTFPNANIGPHTGSTLGRAEQWQLDPYMAVDVVFDPTTDKIIQFSPIYSHIASYWVEPPNGYTGLWRTFYANGQLRHEIEYAEGAYHGAWRAFHDDGTLASEQYFENGESVPKTIKGPDTSHGSAP
jgi:hypothetical protein